MNRKNTILIAVMVNAGLLVLLLITALTTQEEILSSPSIQMAESAPALPKVEPIEMSKPLFVESADQTLRQPAAPAPEAKPIAVKPAEKPAPVEAPVVHNLPPVAAVQETPPAPEPTAAPVVAAAPAAPAPDFFVIVVKKGDSLDKIAKAHHTTVDAIIKINQLPSSFLRVGQQLKIPAEKTLSSAPKPKAQPMKEEGSPEYYIVKVGDNPWTIAMKHHMKVEELLRLNGLNEEKARKLKAGDRLRTR
ncbi:MAG: LysM peptidoglycan-binding domain-containing protein [Verrucomicrobia bacterium]|nr:LysM peptidoglycan-binding domain-containing protein [Verrucomicrobiota bacterium]